MNAASALLLGGREIVRMGLGGARWSIEDPADDGAAEALLRRAVESGVQYLDTARAYTRRGVEGHNEALIARTLDRMDAWDQVLVATKGGHYRAGDDYRIDATPDALRRDCEQSLRILGRDALDLYYLHIPDPAVPLEDSLEALAGLRTEGAIRAIGLCNASLEEVRAALGVAPLAAVQNRLSPYDEPDRELLALCAANDIAFFGYSPLGGGTRPAPLADLSPTATSLAAETGERLESILLAWLFTLGAHVGLITGARRSESLASSLRALELGIDSDAVAAIALELERSRGAFR